MIIFEVFGPFEVPFSRGRGGRPKKTVSTTTASDFWKQINASDAYAHLAAKKGCYVFAMRAGAGSMPWYVGKADKGKMTLRNEVFAPEKCRKYNDALRKSNRRMPEVFLLVRTSGQGRIGKAVDDLETLLIWMAGHRNKHIINKRKRKTQPAKLVRLFRRIAIKNLVNAERGQPNKSAKKFERMMKIRER